MSRRVVIACLVCEPERRRWCHPAGVRRRDQREQVYEIFMFLPALHRRQTRVRTSLISELILERPLFGAVLVTVAVVRSEEQLLVAMQLAIAQGLHRSFIKPGRHWAHRVCPRRRGWWGQVDGVGAPRFLAADFRITMADGRRGEFGEEVFIYRRRGLVPFGCRPRLLGWG